MLAAAFARTEQLHHGTTRQSRAGVFPGCSAAGLPRPRRDAAARRLPAVEPAVGRRATEICMAESRKTRVIIMGAAGRDFHNFNVYWKSAPDVEVVCFTATQIPNIDGRVYPAALAGPQYPNGIPIHPEDRLEELIHDLRADQVSFSYSDVSHEYVMHQ